MSVRPSRRSPHTDLRSRSLHQAPGEAGWHNHPATSSDEFPGGDRARQPRLSDEVYEHIFRQIASGQLETGTRLPTEADFCEAFSVSRPVVRDALARLRADGLISSRQGSGSYVSRRPDHDFLRFAPSGGIAELLRCFEFRIGLEGDAAWFAAERRSASDLSTIKLACERMASANATGGLGSQADLAFHLAVAEASGNALYVKTLIFVQRQIEFGMRLARSISMDRGGERLERVQHEHILILDTIRARDPAAARDAMQRHIANARARILTEEPRAAVPRVGPNAAGVRDRTRHRGSGS